MDIPTENFTMNTLTAVIWLGSVIISGLSFALIVIWRKWNQEMKDRKKEIEMITKVFEKIGSNQDLTTSDLKYIKSYAEDSKPIIKNIDKNVEKIIS